MLIISRTFYLYSILAAMIIFREAESSAKSSNSTKSEARAHPNSESKHFSCLKSTYGYKCEKITLAREEFQVLFNGTVYVHSYDVTLDQCHYDRDLHRLVICKPGGTIEKESMEIPCGVQLALYISVVSVLLPLFFSMLTEDIRDLTRINWKGLIISIIFFHFLLEIINIDRITEAPVFRYTFPALMHFFTLVLLSWMTIFSHDGMMMGDTAVAEQGSNYLEQMRNYKGYLMSVFTTIILLVAITMVTQVLGMIPDIYRPDSGDFCWLTQKSLMIFFTGPVVAFSSINFLNFLSAFFYFTRQSETLNSAVVLVLKKNYLVHFKVFVVMDMAWFLAVLVFISESEALWKTYVFSFIFLESFIVIVPLNKNLENWALKKLTGS